MNFIEKIFQYKKFDESSLLRYGFNKNGDEMEYGVVIMEGSFLMTVTVAVYNVSVKLVDTFNDEPYTLFLVEDAQGSFVGQIRSEISAILCDICEKCCTNEIFKSSQTKRLIEYAKEKYGSELEFLWADTPDNAILRCAENNKWYAAILTVKKRYFGINEDGKFEIADLSAEPEKINSLVDNKKYYKGYHMNKKHWITIILDDTLSDDELFSRLDDSYIIAHNK